MKKQIRFVGSYENVWPHPPGEIEEALRLWFRVSGVTEEATYWIEWVEEVEEKSADAFPIVSVVSCGGTESYYQVDLRLPWRGRPASWRIRLTINDLASLRESWAMERALDLLQEDPALEDGKIHKRMRLLYEMLHGRDFLEDALSIVWLAPDAGFETPRALAAGLRYLAEKGCYVSYHPKADAERQRDGFVWTEAFHVYMETVSELRREELLALSPLTIAEFVQRLDDGSWEMLHELGRLKPQMMDAGPEVRIPNNYFQTIGSHADRFVGWAAAAGIFVAVGDNPSGLLGKTWRLSSRKYDEALEMCAAITRDRDEEYERLISSAPETPELSFEAKLAKDLASLRASLAFATREVARCEKELGDKDREIEDLMYRLAGAKREREALKGCLAEHSHSVSWVTARIHDVELEQTALQALIDDEAKEVLEMLEKRAHAANLDPASLLEAFQRALAAKRPS